MERSDRGNTNRLPIRRVGYSPLSSQGSDEDMGYEPVFRESDPVHMHPDYAGATGPVIHGPDPRMAPHLMP